MITLRNPYNNVVIVEDTRDFGRNLQFSYFDNEVLMSLNTKSQFKMFIITNDNKEIFNVFKKFLLSIKESNLYDIETDGYCYDYSEYFISQKLAFNIIYDKVNDVISIFDARSNECPIMFNIYEGEDEILIAFRVIQIDKIKLIDKIKISIGSEDKEFDELYISFLKLFESLINSDSLKLVNKRKIC